jgi:hypothetical protein
MDEQRFKEICREEGASEKATDEYWKYEQMFQKVTGNMFADDKQTNEQALRFTIRAILAEFPSDRATS